MMQDNIHQNMDLDLGEGDNVRPDQAYYIMNKEEFEKLSLDAQHNLYESHGKQC